MLGLRILSIELAVSMLSAILLIAAFAVCDKWRSSACVAAAVHGATHIPGSPSEHQKGPPNCSAGLFGITDSGSLLFTNNQAHQLGLAVGHEAAGVQATGQALSLERE